MKGTEGFQSVNKATVGLGVLLVLLFLNLAFGNPLFHLFFGAGVSAGTRPMPPQPKAASKDQAEKAPPKGASRLTAGAATKVKDEFARYDPSLNLDELKDILSRPAPQPGRNPFELKATPKALATKADAPAPPQPVAPPPPPPIPLKAEGYSEKPGGVKEAYITDDQEVYVVHEGEEFGKGYKALKITPQQIEVEDETNHRTVQLLVPQ
jgi:hypothetical protein